MKQCILTLTVATLCLLFAQTKATLTGKCNQSVLAYYGLTGTAKPVPYKNRIGDLNVNVCPKMKNTCCLAQDFNQSLKLWDVASIQIQRLLSQYYVLLQNMAISQRLVLPFIMNLQAISASSCKRIDTTFFKNPIAFDQMNVQIKSALETFAYLQRGFYCMICNADNHDFFDAGADFGRLMVAMDNDFCPLLIDQMRDFLTFKVFYFDPMVINMNAVIDCSNGVDSAYFDNSYRVEYDNLNDCLSNGNNCEQVCYEFRLGSTSNLFLGKVSEYRRILEQFQRVILKYNPNAALPTIEKELDGNVQTEFFAQQTLDLKVGPLNTNLSRYDVLLKRRGLNPFTESVNVEYSYVTVQGQDTVTVKAEKKISADPAKRQEHMATEAGDKLSTLQANDLLPQATEISSMNGDINDLEADFQNELKKQSLINPEDTSSAGIKQN